MIPRPSSKANIPSNQRESEEGSLFLEKLTIASDSVLIGEYSEALALVMELRAAYVGNIYLDTMAKQVELLLSLTNSNALTEEQRSEILDTIPGLIECASVEAEEHVQSPALRETADSWTETTDRKVVVANLVNDFLANVEQYVIKGKYQEALTEIQRIYRIDPQNATAKSLEQTIGRKVSTLVAASHPRAKPDDILPPTADPLGKKASAPPKKGVYVAPVTAVQAVIATPPRPEPTPALAPTRKRRPTILVGTLAIASLGLGLLIFLQRDGSDDPSQLPVLPHKERGNATAAIVPETQPDLQTSNGKNADSLLTSQPLNDVRAERTTDTTVGVAIVSLHQEQSAVLKDVVKEISDSKGKKNVEGSRPVTSLGPPSEKTPVKVDVATVQKNPVSPAVNEPLPEVILPMEAFVVVQKDPQILRLEKPLISERAFMTNKSAQVVVRVQIGPDGKPLQAKIVKSTNPLVNNSIIKAVMKSEYSPGVMSSGPVTTWVSIPFNIRK
ncbi:MAG: TonB family protein [Bacteroidetes bacterium]|nr:TonB family protein [Bacteroidota bacterium]